MKLGAPMDKNYLKISIEKDIEDVRGLINYKEYDANIELIKKQARGILLNLKDHLNEYLN